MMAAQAVALACREGMMSSKDCGHYDVAGD